MKKKLTLIISAVMMFVSCNQKSDIETSLMKMKSRSVNLCLQEMQCRNKRGDTIVVDSVKPSYRMVVYVDSTECSPCTIDKMYMWNDAIKKAKKGGNKLRHVFIFAPKPDQIEDTYLSIESSGLDSYVYVDTAYAFRRENPHVPQDRMFHFFLIDDKDSVVIVGNPIEHPKIDSLVNRIVNK